MTAGLVRLGMLVLAAALVGLLLSSTGVEGLEPFEPWIQTGLAAGVALIVGGIGLGLLGRVGRAAMPSRCARCEAPVLRGHVYCADHLKATVDEARDHLHMRNLDRGAQG